MYWDPFSPNNSMKDFGLSNFSNVCLFSIVLYLLYIPLLHFELEKLNFNKRQKRENIWKVVLSFRELEAKIYYTLIKITGEYIHIYLYLYIHI